MILVSGPCRIDLSELVRAVVKRVKEARTRQVLQYPTPTCLAIASKLVRTANVARTNSIIPCSRERIADLQDGRELYVEP